VLGVVAKLMKLFLWTWEDRNAQVGSRRFPWWF